MELPSATQLNTTDLVNYYPFDQNDISGSTIKNNSNGTYDLTLNNGASIITYDKKIGSGCLFFNQSITSQYAVLDQNSLIITNKGLSIALWMKFSNDRTVFNFGNGYRSDNIIFNSCKHNNEDWNHFIVYQGGSRCSKDTVQNFHDNNWYHIVWTMTPSTSSTSTWNIYINGNLKSTHTNCFYPSIITRTKNYFGYDAEMYHQHYASGSIDDFRIYNRILSLADVRQLVINKI
jgi:hypothetical protein